MATTNATDTSAATLKPFVETDRTEFIRVLVAGIVAGILVPLLATLLNNVLIKPLFCNNGGTTGVCTAGGMVTAYHSAAILVGVGFVALLANWGVFRPLPLVAGVTVALWGLQKYLNPLSTDSWLEFYVFSAVLSGLSYLLFYWIMRLRNFALSLILAAVAAGLIFWVFTL